MPRLTMVRDSYMALPLLTSYHKETACSLYVFLSFIHYKLGIICIILLDVPFGVWVQARDRVFQTVLLLSPVYTLSRENCHRHQSSSKWNRVHRASC